MWRGWSEQYNCENVQILHVTSILGKKPIITSHSVIII